MLIYYSVDYQSCASFTERILSVAALNATENQSISRSDDSFEAIFDITFEDQKMILAVLTKDDDDEDPLRICWLFDGVEHHLWSPMWWFRYYRHIRPTHLVIERLLSIAIDLKRLPNAPNKTAMDKPDTVVS